MTTMVCFRSAGTDYCMPVHAARAVRRSSGMISLPDPVPTSPASSQASRR